MAASSHGTELEATNDSTSNQGLMNACVDSAVRTIELLRGLDAYEKIPKRLPFVVNSIFVSALVLGIAFFGDLDRSFPLERSLHGAQDLLRRFHNHDAQAKRNLMIVEYLDAACKTYIERRDREKMEGHSKLVGGIFGRVHNQGSVISANRSMTFAPNDVRGPQMSDQRSLASNLNSRYPTNTQSNEMLPCTNNEPETIDITPSKNTGQIQQIGHPGGMDNNVFSSGLDGYHDPVLGFSSQSLWFESYEETMPLFSTLHTGQFR
jgi:hypothetical protein